MSANIDEQFILHEEALDELYTWIDGIPLSRPKKNIARDFSDGVLCAEIVSHFAPKTVDMHNYFPASSAMQKKINWSTLNRKVFSKMGVRLSENTIQQLIDAKPGAIEQVLWDVRRKIQLEGGSYTRRPATASSRTNNIHSRYEQNDVPPLGYRGSIQEQDLDESPTSLIRTSTKIPSTNPNTMNHQHISYKTPSPNLGLQTTNTYQNSYQTQGYVAGPAKHSPSAVSAESNNNPGIPPPQIVYRGHKMVPLTLLEEREREIKSLEVTNKTLLTKSARTENLVNVKDQRIEDLTHQIHNLRTLYERVTQQTWQGY